MALKLIHTINEGIASVKVYKDSQWQEFRARLYINNKLQPLADAFDDDKESILGTASHMIKHAFEQQCACLILHQN